MLSSKMHKYLAIGWAVTALPTALWWRDSVFFVSLVSIYANCVGHWAAFQASKAEEKVPTDPQNDGNINRALRVLTRAVYKALSWLKKAPPGPPNVKTDSPATPPAQSPPESPQTDEKARRMYYQGIVYRVCNLLELTKEGTSRICCGTVEAPSIEVEVELALALKELATLRKKLREQ